MIDRFGVMAITFAGLIVSASASHACPVHVGLPNFKQSELQAATAPTTAPSVTVRASGAAMSWVPPTPFLDPHGNEALDFADGDLPAAISSASVSERSTFEPKFFLEAHEGEAFAFIAADRAAAGAAGAPAMEMSPFHPSLFLDPNESETLALIAAELAAAGTSSSSMVALTQAELSSGSAEIEIAAATHREALALAEVFGLADPGPAEILTASIVAEFPAETTGSILPHSEPLEERFAVELEASPSSTATPADRLEVGWP